MTYIFRTHTPRDFNILIYVFVVAVDNGLISFVFFLIIIFYLDQPDTKPIFGYSHISTIAVHKQSIQLRIVLEFCRKPGPFFLKKQMLFV